MKRHITVVAITQREPKSASAPYIDSTRGSPINPELFTRVAYCRITLLRGCFVKNFRSQILVERFKNHTGECDHQNKINQFCSDVLIHKSFFYADHSNEQINKKNQLRIQHVHKCIHNRIHTPSDFFVIIVIFVFSCQSAKRTCPPKEIKQ